MVTQRRSLPPAPVQRLRLAPRQRAAHHLPLTVRVRSLYRMPRQGEPPSGHSAGELLMPVAVSALLRSPSSR